MKINTQVLISPFYEKRRNIRFTHPAFARHNFLKTILTIIKQYLPCRYLPLASQCLEKGHFLHFLSRPVNPTKCIEPGRAVGLQISRGGAARKASPPTGPGQEQPLGWAQWFARSFQHLWVPQLEIFRLRSFLKAPLRSKEAHRQSWRLADMECFTCRMAFLPPVTTTLFVLGGPRGAGVPQHNFWGNQLGPLDYLRLFPVLPILRSSTFLPPPTHR